MVDFEVTSDGFTFGPASSDGWGLIGTDVVRLGERNGFVAQAQLPVALGQASGTRTLRARIETFFDRTDEQSVTKDRLLVYLVDPSDPSQTLLDHGQPGTALFSLSEDRAEFPPGLVTFNGSQLDIDLTSLGNQISGLLLFQLISGDSDTGSQVAISSISNELDEEGITRPVISDGIDTGAGWWPVGPERPKPIYEH